MWFTWLSVWHVVCKAWVLSIILSLDWQITCKSHIKHRRRTCGVVNHFIDVHGGEHSNLKFMLIDSNNDDLRKCENFWIGTLLTNLRGLNTSHDFSQQ